MDNRLNASSAQAEPQPGLRLNLGCGNDIRDGYVNVDDVSSNHVLSDRLIKADLNQFPWPFADNSADEILMWHVLEHLPDTYKVMTEIKRILKPGGFFWGQVPYAWSYSSFSHPQHYRHFTEQSFQKLGEDFKMEWKAKNGRVSAGWKWRIRNIFLPGRIMEIIGLNNSYDVVDFKMTKRK